MHIRDDAVRVGEAKSAVAAEQFQGSLRRVGSISTIPREAHAQVRGLLDRVVGTSLGMAVLAQNVQLMPQRGKNVLRTCRVMPLFVSIRAGNVAGIGIARHEAQRLLLARSPEEDGRPRPVSRPWLADRLGQLVVPTLERCAIARPHLPRDLERFLETAEALGERGEWETQAGMFALESCRADSDVRATAGEDIQG